jgi:hypothetical protein
MTNAAPTPVALAHIAKRKKKFPPLFPERDGRDRAQQLYRSLGPFLPDYVQNLFATGAVAIGEVGERAPDIRTIPLKGDAFAIEFTSGMMDFVYAVTRALAGVLVGYSTAGPTNKAALELPDTAALVANVFAQWKKHNGVGLWRPARIARPDFPAAPGVLTWAELVATHAELFMLSHEIGHVIFNRRLAPPLHENDEENADAAGLSLFLVAGSGRGLLLRHIYNGAVFAVRIFAAMQNLGHRFSEKYPPQARRIELLKEQMRALSPSEQFLHEASTIAVAYEDQFDSVEALLQKNSAPRPQPKFDRILVRLIAELEEAAHGRLPEKKFIDDIGAIAGRVPSEMMRRVLETLVRYYDVPGSDGHIPREIREKMGQVWRSAASQFPDSLKQALPASA